MEATGADGVALASAPRKKVHVSSRLSGLSRKLEFPDGAAFETGDNDGVDRLVRGSSGLLYRLERSWRLVLAYLAAMLVITAVFAMYGVPMAAQWLAERTPASVTRLATSQALRVMVGKVLTKTKLPTPRQAEIRRRFDRIAGWQKQPSRFQLLFRNAPSIGPNAFALPDGRIVVTDELVLMAQNNAEIDGVLAHEMAHVNHAHGLQSLYQASLVPAAIAFATGDASQLGQFTVILPGLLLQSAYSRDFEQQADDDAAAALRRHGEDPAALAGFLERMDLKICGKTGCGPSWLGSHPATAARAARLRRAP
jgi:Zn-dependent protease with chaperone function